MTEPMADERLAEIRACAEAGEGTVTGKFLSELLGEVDRLRALMEVPKGFPATAIEPTSEQIAEWQAAWDKLCAGQVVGYDLRPAPWPPGPRLSDRLPRSHDYPAGG